MSVDDPGTADLRALLSGPPGRLAFRVLAARIAQHPDPQEATALAEAGLSSWPDADRCAPWSWYAGIVAGSTPEPGWWLARSLDLSHPRLWGAVPSTWHGPADGLAHLSQISLPRPCDLLDTMVSTPDAFRDLRILSVGSLPEDRCTRGRGLCASPVVSQLRGISLGCYRSVRLSPPDYTRLLCDGAPTHVPRGCDTLRVLVPTLAELGAFLERCPLPALRDLTVVFAQLDAARPIGAAACAALQRLRRLALVRCTPEVVAALFTEVDLDPDELALEIVNADGARLRQVDVPRNVVSLSLAGPDAAAAVLSRATPRGLVRFALADPGRASTRKLRGHLGAVEDLTLSGTTRDSAAMASLLETGSLGALRRLSVDRTGSRSYDGAVVLAAVTAAGLGERLEHLSIRGSDARSVTADALGALLQAGVPALTSLSLRSSRMGDEAVGVIANAQIPALEHLDLGLCAVSGVGLSALLSARGFPRLRTLSLTVNKVEDLETDLVLGDLSALRVLDLSGNPIGGTLVAHPAFRTLLAQLWSLSLADTPLGDATVRRLAEGASGDLVHLDLTLDRSSGITGAPAWRLRSDATAAAIGASRAFAGLDEMVGYAIDYTDMNDGMGWPRPWHGPFGARGRAGIAGSSLRPAAIASLLHPGVTDHADPDRPLSDADTHRPDGGAYADHGRDEDDDWDEDGET